MGMNNILGESDLPDYANNPDAIFSEDTSNQEKLIELLKITGGIEKSKLHSLVYILSNLGFNFPYRYKLKSGEVFSDDLWVDITNLIEKDDIVEIKEIEYYGILYKIYFLKNLDIIMDSSLLNENKELLWLLNRQEIPIIKMTSATYFIRNTDTIYLENDMALRRKITYMFPEFFGFDIYSKYISKAWALYDFLQEQKTKK